MSIQSNYVYTRGYRGKVKGLVLDWSGTTADEYVLAPAVVFVDVFKKYNVEISMAEARGPMGLRKDLHILELTKVPEIRERWKTVYGKYTTLLPHVAEVTQKFQKEGIKIGSSTGFVRSMVDILEEDAKKQGYTPDASVAGDEVINGARPKPFMVYRNLDLMNVNPIQSVVKVDDTVSGVGEALEAGCWGVGIARYSNYMDMDTLEEAGSLSEEEIQRRLIKTRDILQKAGAHYVIDTFDQLVDVVDDINLRLSRGERP